MEVEENRQINYKQIKKSSGIEEKFSQEIGNLIQDDVVYQRAANRGITKLYGDLEEEIPNQLRKIETYDPITKSKYEENFHENREGLDFFYIPSLLKVSY